MPFFIFLAFSLQKFSKLHQNSANYINDNIEHPYMRIIPSPILEHDIVLNGIRNKNEPRGQEIENDSQRGITGVQGKEYHHHLIARTLEWYIKGIEELGIK